MLRDGRILTEHGEYLTIRTYQELSDALYTHGLQLFVGAIMSANQDWLEDMYDDMAAEGRPEREQWAELRYSQNRQEFNSLIIHRKWVDSTGRRRCWQARNMTVSSTWARAVEPELLPDLRYVFTLLKTGVLPTPGATGAATMKRLWAGKSPKEFRRHFRPSLALIEKLEQHAVGSRRETYRPSEIFEEAYELDAANGYCAQSGELPCGKAVYYTEGKALLYDEPDPEIFCYWADCWVRIYDNGLAPGDVTPFAVRDEDGRLHWPTSAGLYRTYLWSFEAEEIKARERAGEPISMLTMGEAYAWRESTTQLQEWQQEMDAARREAKGHSKACADLVKVIIVASIGALGVPYTVDDVSTEQVEGAVPLNGPGLYGDRQLYILRKFKDTGTPKHWQSYILGRMNFRVYQELRRCYLSGVRVAAVNVDGIITLDCPYWGSDPEYVRIGEFKMRKLGSWVAVPGPGILLDPDNQRIQVPGMSKLEKDRAMGLYRLGERDIPVRGEKPREGPRARETWRAAAHANAERLRAYILREA